MCTSPLKGFILGTKDNGKYDLKVTSYDVDHLEVTDNGLVKKYKPPVTGLNSVVSDFLELPCGQCIECRLNRSRQWANRCMLEATYHPQSLFLTLTYDNEHLPTNEIITPDGEIAYVGTLVKSDMSKFMKALRQEYSYHHDNELRFFGCGEYGSDTMRPHFHIIVFGLLLDDLVFHHKNFQGDMFFTSETLQKCWRNKGFVLASDVTWDTCAYTARYIMKKHLGKDKVFYEDNCLEPEFINMSRRPGIARQYYEDHPEIFDYDYISVPGVDKPIYPPRYYEHLYEMDFPDDAAKRKEKKIADIVEQKNQILEKSSLNYVDYLKVKEYNLEKRIKGLVRKEI